MNKFNLTKALLIITIIFFLMPLFVTETRSSNFNVTPMNIHYLGVVSTSKNIIVYGTNGSYLMSTDAGKNWQQRSMHPYGEIRKIVNFRDTLWGVIDKGIIVKSTDHGVSWEKHKFGLDKDDKFIYILVNENGIYARSRFSVFHINRELKLLNSFTDERIKQKVITHEMPDDAPAYYGRTYHLHDLKGKIVVSLDYGEKGMFVLTKDLKKSNFFDLKYILENKFADTTKWYTLRDLFYYNNKPVLNIYKNLYYYNEDSSKWSYFYRDTTYLNCGDSIIRRHKWSNQWGYIGDYFCLNGEIFLKYVKENKSNLGFDNMGLKKYHSEPNDTMISFGNLFNNKYYTSEFRKSGNDGLNQLFYYDKYGSKFHIFRDSVLIKVSWYKSILQSRDNANSWELVSHMSGNPKHIFNDSTYLFFNDIPKNNEVNLTGNYGITFKPTENKEFDTTYPNLNFTLNKYNKKGMFYMDSTGKGIISARSELGHSYDNNIAITYDSGRSYRFTTLEGFDAALPLSQQTIDGYFQSNFVQMEDNYLVYKNNASRNKFYTRIYKIDTSLKKTKEVIWDSTFLVHYFIPKNPDHYYLLTTNQKSDNLFQMNFEIKETKDGGKTYNTINAFNRRLDIIQFYQHNEDSLFFACEDPTRVYLYSVKTNVIDTIYKSDKDTSNKSDKYENAHIMYLSGQFYIVGKDMILKNTDKNDLTKWTEAEWDYGTPSFESVIFNGNVALAKLSDSLRPENYYRIMLDEYAPTPVKEPKSEIKYYTTHFYASPPYPIPGKTSVKTKIIWDSSFDLQDAIKGVYNIKGTKIQRKENINLKFTGKTSAILTWDCSTVSNGIYFIIVKHHGRTESIPVLIEK